MKLRGKKATEILGQTVLWVILIASLLIFSVPFFFMITNSFEEFSYVLPYPPKLFPTRLDFSAYRHILSMDIFPTALANSVINTVITVVISVFVSTLSAYGFACIRFPGRDKLFAVYLFTLMMPGFLNIIPQFLVLKQLTLPGLPNGLIGTRAGLILVYVATNVCGHTFFLRNFFRSLPSSLAESVLLDGDIRTVTIKHTPEIIAWAEDYDIRLDGDVTLPIRNAYNNYVDVCIGELGASFHPVVYLLTEDGFVEYVDVLRCLLYGQILLCADPIYIANNGTALALRDAEVSLLCADGTETELAPLTAEWNSPQQVDSTGSFSLGEGENWCWLDLNSGGGCQLATHNNRYFYQGAVTYLGATPNGTALGFSLIRDTENGPEWVAFSAALKLDYRIDCLILTPLSGQNPLTNETVPLVLTHSYG